MASRAPLPAVERRFLLGALFHGALDVPRLRQLAAGPVDWAALVAAAEAGFVGALLFDSIHAAGLAGAVPAPLLARLRATAARVATRNAAHRRAAGRAAELLLAGGVGSLLLKGTGLAVHAPRYFAVRYQNDVDLLVERAHLDQAGRLLLAGGFAPAPAFAGLVGLDGRPPLGAGSLHATGHHLPPLLSPEGSTLELHFEPPGRLPRRAVEALRAEVAVAPGYLRTSAPDALLGLLCAHVHVHHGDQADFLLRHVADVVALEQAGGSLERARRDFGSAVDASRRLVEETRSAAEGTARRPGRLEASLASPAWSPRALASAWRRAFRSRRWLLQDGGLEALLPSPRFMAQRYGLDEHSPLLPLAYPWRMLAALGRALLGR